MSCRIPNLDEARNAIKNGEHLYIFESPNQKDSVSSIDHTNEIFTLVNKPNAESIGQGDDMFRYALASDPDVYFSRRVTHRSTLRFEKGKTTEQLEQIRNNPNTKIRRDGGTFVHDIAQRIGESYEDSIKNENEFNDELIKQYALQGNNGFKLNEKQFESLKDGIIKVVDEIHSKQDQINQRLGTNGKVEIRFESILVDPISDEAGTMDVVAIFSDNTAMIYDYKTMSNLYQYTENGVLVKDGFIYASKKEDWKLQASTYKRILLQRHGVKDVLGTRIVPIWIEFGYDKSNKRITKKMSELQIGEDQSEYLKQVMATYEKTDIQEIDRFLTKRYKRIEELKKKRTSANWKEITDRIERIESSIYSFIINADISDMITDVIAEGVRISERFDSEDLTIDELYELELELKGVVSYINNFDQSYDIPPNKEDEFYKKLRTNMNKIQDQILSLKTLLGRIKAEKENRILDEVEAAQGKIRDERGNVRISEDDWFTRNFSGMRQFSNPFIKHAKKLIDESNQFTREGVEEVAQEVAEKEDAVYEWLRSRNEGHKDLINHIVNKNTDNLVPRISKEFFDLESKAKKDGNASWFVNNYEISDKKKYNEWYKKTLKSVQENAKVRFPDDKRKQNRIIKDWIEKNNYALKNGRPLYPKAWYSGKKYFLTIKESSKKKYETDEYKFIRKHEPLKNYYDMIVDMNAKFRDLLGLDYNQLNFTFLPNIRAEAIEKLSRGEIQSVGKDFAEMFSVREDTTTFGTLNRRGVEKDVPIFFVNPFRNDDGSIKVGEKTYDFGKSLILFSKMAYNYANMKKIEGTINALQDTMNSRVEFYMKDTKGKKIFDFMGNLATKTGAEGKVPSVKVFNALVDYYVYGIRIQERGVDIPGTDINSTEALLKVKNYLSLKALGFGFIPATASFVAASTAAWIEGKKGVLYTSKQWNRATKSAAKDIKKYSALAYYFGVYSDDITEQVSVTNKGKKFLRGDRLERNPIRKYVNGRMLMRPYSYGDERLDNNIAVAMSMNYGISEDGKLRRLKNLPEGAKSLWDRFNYDHDSGDVTIDGITDSDTIRSVKISFRNLVRDGQQGIKGSMSQEEINYAQTNLVMNLLMQFKTWMPGLLRERFGNLRYNDVTDAPEWGRYRAVFSDFGREKDVSIATWLFKTVAKNAATVAADVATFGIYKYQVNDAKAKRQYKKYKMRTGDNAMSYDDFIEIKQGQIRAFMNELRVLMAFAALLAMLGADWDDDGTPMYRQMWMLHKIYQVLNRTNTEIGFTLNPLELEKLVRTPFAIGGVLTDVIRMTNNTVDETLDVLTDRYDGRDKTGKFYYFMALIPGGFQLRRLFNLYEQDEQASR